MKVPGDLLKKNPTLNEIEQLYQHVNDMMIEEWQRNFLFTWKWWLLLILTIVPWMIWWKFIDKKRITEILLFGVLIIITSTFLDIIGWSFSLWFYPNILLPICTPLVPINYTLLPIGYMVIYQNYRKWKTFVIAIILLSAFYSFVLEPASEWLNFYKQLNWKHIYSFPGYIFIGIVFKWLVEKIVRTQHNHP